jgi:hypothetical protein
MVGMDRKPAPRAKAASPVVSVVPPHDGYAERITLGGLLLVTSDERRDAILGAVSAEDFYNPLHRATFLAITAAHENGGVGIAAVADALRGQCEDPYGFLLGLLDDVSTTHEGQQEARIVARLARARRALALSDAQRQAAVEGDLQRVRENAEQLLTIDDEQDGFALAPLDIETLLRDGVPEPEFLSEPYIPAARRIWVFGPAESAKSMWALHQAALITRSGRVVMFVSEENPTDEDLRRLARLGFELDYLRFYKETGMDLSQPGHARALICAAEREKAALVVLDTLTAMWAGDENDNRAVIDLDLQVMRPLVLLGVSVLVLDHTGHPQMFVRRSASSAGRGASSKGHKADVVLKFDPKADRGFSITVGKYRVGNARKPANGVAVTFEVIDTEDGGLDVARAASDSQDGTAEVAEAMVSAIESEPGGYLTTKRLREAVKTLAGRERAEEAMQLLRDQRRVRVSEEVVDSGRGRSKATVWRLAREEEPNELDLE